MAGESSAIIKLPHRVAEKIKKEARKLGLSLEKYVVDPDLRDLDPSERAEEYIEAAKDLLEQAGAECILMFRGMVYRLISHLHLEALRGGGSCAPSPVGVCRRWEPCAVGPDRRP